jgi:hypothetical protein
LHRADRITILSHRRNMAVRIAVASRSVSEPAPSPPGQRAPELKLPSDRDWERSAMLEPRPGPRHPELISDGTGLPFSPAALAGTPAPLDPGEAAAAALLAHLTARSAPKRSSRAPWKRRAAPAPPPSLDGWRLLARTDDEVLFGLGRAPKLLTVGMRRAGLRRSWTVVGVSSSRPLRAVRDGIRASSWRPDPTHDVRPEDTVLRVLVTEQTFSSGQRADDRLLAPELFADEAELILTMFIKPRPGYQSAAGNRETPARITLPEPVGERRLIDGALAQFSWPEPPPGPAD